MGKSLNDIALQLKSNDKKVQLIYAFNGTGKTRLSREFKALYEDKSDIQEEKELESRKILYYNAFTEDLFYWDNDLESDLKPTMQIQTNIFTKWIFEDQGQDRNIISTFQYYTDKKLSPNFNSDFSEVTFSYESGNDEHSDNIKISKGEESCFVWSVFYSLLDQVVNVLNIPEKSDRETDQFDNLEYVFIDDPVSSLDENHLIELAVNIAQLIKSSKSKMKFIITTHNPLFYNVLHNAFKGKAEKFLLKRDESGEYDLASQNSDSPFSYHLDLKAEIANAIETGQLKKYHFNFLRNILEKTSTFLGYENWSELLPEMEGGGTNAYASRIINISSHSKYSGDEISELSEDNKRVLKFLMGRIKGDYKFK